MPAFCATVPVIIVSISLPYSSNTCAMQCTKMYDIWNIWKLSTSTQLWNDSFLSCMQFNATATFKLGPQLMLDDLRIWFIAIILNMFRFIWKVFEKKNVNECHYIWWNVLSLRINVRFILRLSCCIQAIIKITLRQLKNLTRCQMETEWHYNWKCCCSAFWWVKHINACWERLDMKLEWHIWRYARTRV